MVVKEIFLLKTPLDDSYKNVIDFNFDVITYHPNETPKEMLYNLMVGNFDNMYLQINNRGFKKSVDLTSITIPKEYIEIRDYNYCIIVTDYLDEQDAPLFYFINNIVSENDSLNSPSCTLTLKWDAWSNNINEITNSNSQNTIEQGHYRNYDGLSLNSPSPLFYPCKIPNIPVTLEECIYDKRYVPLFMRIIMRNFPEWGDTDHPAYELTKMYFNPSVGVRILDGGEYYGGCTSGRALDSLGGTYGLPVLYALVGLYDIKNGDFVGKYYIKGDETYFRLGKSSGLIGQEVQCFYQDLPPRLVNERLMTSIDSKYYDVIETIEYTFNSPFEYDIIDEFKVINADTLPCIKLKAFFGSNYLTDLIYVTNNIVGDITIDSIPIPQDVLVDYKTIGKSRISTFNNKDFLYQTQLSNKRLFRVFEINTENPQINGIASYIVEPKTYDYPLNYLSVNTLYDEYLPMRTGLADKQITLEVQNVTRTPMLKIKIDGNNIITPSAISLNSSGIFSRAENALASYLNRNGETIRNNIIMNSIGRILSTTSTISKNLGDNMFKDQGSGSQIIDSITSSTFGFVKEITSLNANLEDLSHTPDRVTVSHGECDIYYQDRVRVIKHSCDTTSHLYQDIMEVIYKYGYDYISIVNIFDNNKFFFDFIKTSNCSLHNIKINSMDRATLESAFNRGVTKWHINKLVRNSNKLLFPITFIPSVNTCTNIDKQWYYNLALYDWANS